MEFLTTVGLEVHCELSTKSKIFCSCTTEFGGEPNTHVCEVCTGMPGVLPVLNKNVVEYAIRTGLATNCEITRYTKFDRKNYFYPDLPKAYQTSQLYLPICQNGHIDIEVNGNKKSIRIKEIHMEEDAGKLIHDASPDTSLVDYNRCGIPLLEIVSEPDFESSEEVIAYLTKLKAILQYIDVSDCKMEQGSLRADINLSVRKNGDTELGTRTEMKNLNSFRSIARAVEGESKRQIEVIKEGGKIIQETRRWDDNKGTSFSMRTKENAQDYRYFPEPDLVPIQISDEWIEKVRKSIPELPHEKKIRYINDYNLPEYDVDIITGSKYLVKLFEGAINICNEPKEVSNWIMGEVLRMASETATELEDIKFEPENLGKLILLFKNKTITREVAKEVFEKMFTDNVNPAEYVEKNNLAMVNDDNLVIEVVKGVIEANPKAVDEYKSGSMKVKGFIVGQCMKQLKGKADPGMVNRIIDEELNKI